MQTLALLLRGGKPYRQLIEDRGFELTEDGAMTFGTIPRHIEVSSESDPAYNCHRRCVSCVLSVRSILRCLSRTGTGTRNAELEPERGTGTGTGRILFSISSVVFNRFCERGFMCPTKWPCHIFVSVRPAWPASVPPLLRFCVYVCVCVFARSTNQLTDAIPFIPPQQMRFRRSF